MSDQESCGSLGAFDLCGHNAGDAVEPDRGV